VKHRALAIFLTMAKLVKKANWWAVIVNRVGETAFSLIVGV
jgi:hypothetical protein